jgi:hypothetical protein
MQEGTAFAAGQVDPLAWACEGGVCFHSCCTRHGVRFQETPSQMAFT